MPRLIATLLVCLPLASAAGQGPALPPPEQILRGLRSDHPRLLATAADFERLRALCAKPGAGQQWLAHLRGAAEALLAARPVKYEIPDGKRLLAVSRRAKERVLLLGLVYRLTEDRRFADRAWQELDTVTHFKDWNPSHFLDTAEMTFAVAIGYDWLHDVWSPAQREQLRAAIVRLGLHAGLPIYRHDRGWAKAVHNWNQVCNGGLAVGALAIADEEPALAREVLHAALASLPRAMHEFRDGGGWGEGPGYWRYATEYNVYLLAALDTALGHDFRLSELPGFRETGNFPIYFTGPTGQTFNYADAHSGWHGAPQLFWLATRFEQPGWAAAQRGWAANEPSTLDLLWGAAWLARSGPAAALPLDRHFAGIDVAFLRGAWDDPRATFVGFKGGDNRVNHGQLDLGTLVLDALGERWLVDLGPDDYNLPGYFGSRRWDYYRCRAEGHNTLVLLPPAGAESAASGERRPGPDQDPAAQAKLIAFDSQPARASAVADLSAAYADRAERVLRGVALLDRRHVLLQDEITSARGCDVWWFAHTGAKIALDADRRAATLEQNGQKLRIVVLSPPGAALEVLPAAPLPGSPQPERQANEQQGRHPVSKLAIHLPNQRQTQIAVLLTPDHAARASVQPLAEW